jgi:hypothetical protein
VSWTVTCLVNNTASESALMPSFNICEILDISPL